MTAGLEMWSRSPDVAFVDDGERVVLLQLDARPNQPQLLHGSAAAVWRLLRHPRTAAEVEGELAWGGATGTQAAQEIEAFLAEMALHGLVRSKGGVSP